ncbi:hypothetical protein [Segetibacter aerophilus]|uniref:hypothetical protein n=1 Tax=Segetibacter aerophilus TaxID=670293 RepID=UPI0011BF2FBE|nr:hypothetical protein [Segetibacter aerophilus]
MRSLIINVKKIVVVLGVLFLICDHVFSQVDPVGSFNRHVFEKWTGDYLRIGAFKVKGSPYLLGEAFPGVITYKDGKTVTDEKILYDLYNQKAGIDIKKEIFERDIPIESFVMSLPEHMGKQKLLFHSGFVYGKPEMKGYLNVLEDGKKATLLKQFKIRLIADPINNMDKSLKVFEQYSEYYIYLKGDKTLHSIKPRKKDILKEFGDDPFIKSYTTNREIDFSKEAELVILINSYNNNL